jgi:aryl sulfotransferase
MSDEGDGWESIMREAVDAPIEHEYRNVISDNLRWNRFTVRAGDIFVCTPPKCGTTWMQAIVAELLFPDGIPGGRVWEVCPWIDARFEPIDDVVARLDAQEHRRSIKTHTAADGIPWYSKASYIVVGRDGRDAFMSMFNHMRSLRPELLKQLAVSAMQEGIELGAAPVPLEDIHEYFAWSVNDNPMWLTHVASFWEHYGERNVLFVHYNDMQTDLEGEMRRVAAFLDVDVAEERWPRAVERCTFASMKQRSDEIGDFESHFVGGADSFLYKGTNERWRDVLTSEELALFDRRCREVLPADAFAWTTAGRAALIA